MIWTTRRMISEQWLFGKLRWSSAKITKFCRWNLGGDESKDMKAHGLLDAS